VRFEQQELNLNWWHTYQLQYTSKLLICSSTLPKRKPYNTKVMRNEEPTPQKKFQTVEHVRWIWWNSLKSENTKFTIYKLQNSKSIVGMDSYHWRDLFHIQLSLLWSMVVFIWNELWRILRESEHKHTHILTHAKVASLALTSGSHRWKRPIRPLLPSLTLRCFERRFVPQREGGRPSKQPFFVPQIRANPDLSYQTRPY
jgi:hypothetical protein